jgi:hypothetical protein
MRQDDIVAYADDSNLVTKGILSSTNIGRKLHCFRIRISNGVPNPTETGELYRDRESQRDGASKAAPSLTFKISFNKYVFIAAPNYTITINCAPNYFAHIVAPNFSARTGSTTTTPSRKGQRGMGETTKGPRKDGSKGHQRLGAGTWTGQGQHSPEIADEIAPLIHGGMMRRQFPGAGFSGTSTSFGAARTRPQWCGWGWYARASDFLGKSWGILEPAAKSWGSSAGNSGKIWDSDGIVRGCTNHDRRRGGISVT